MKERYCRHTADPCQRQKVAGGQAINVNHPSAMRELVDQGLVAAVRASSCTDVDHQIGRERAVRRGIRPQRRRPLTG